MGFNSGFKGLNTEKFPNTREISRKFLSSYWPIWSDLRVLRAVSLFCSAQVAFKVMFRCIVSVSVLCYYRTSPYVVTKDFHVTYVFWSVNLCFRISSVRYEKLYQGFQHGKMIGKHRTQIKLLPHCGRQMGLTNSLNVIFIFSFKSIISQAQLVTLN